MFESGVAAGDAWIIRNGPIITLSLSNIRFETDSGFAVLMRLPSGFLPDFVLRGNLIDAETDEQNVAMYTDVRVSCHRRTRNTIRTAFTYSTTDAWPSVLPGVAA